MGISDRLRSHQAGQYNNEKPIDLAIKKAANATLCLSTRFMTCCHPYTLDYLARCQTASAILLLYKYE